MMRFCRRCRSQGKPGDMERIPYTSRRVYRCRDRDACDDAVNKLIMALGAGFKR